MTQLPHVLKRIRLNLARSKEFPSGSDHRLPIPSCLRHGVVVSGTAMETGNARQ
ncbi:MAG TPA: hypothetical protein VFQ33_15745 [Xanthobacteraceae bacterium]|nr:hypothetical protein [Xanthobacteraceae bacterium]